jgi:hypothetical protein
MTAIVIDNRGNQPSSGGGAVDSVNGQTGVVILTKGSVGLSNVQNLDQTDPSNIVQSASFRFATDAEKTTWNSKIDATYAYSKAQSDAAYEAKNANIQTHISNTSNPHAVTTSQIGAAKMVDIQKFTSSGTWTKPTGAKLVVIHMLGAGGGGGSGRRGASTTVRCGGGGGAGGVLLRTELDPSLLGSTEAVTVGAGGTGGAMVTASDTNGNPGIVGGSSIFFNFKAAGGNPGAGGSATAGAGGAVLVSTGTFQNNLT